jgi:hypothetical protein
VMFFQHRVNQCFEGDELLGTNSQRPIHKADVASQTILNFFKSTI